QVSAGVKQAANAPRDLLSMTAVLFALLPIATLLALGKGVALTQVLSKDGWLGLERITYFVLFPALIVGKLAVADFSGVDWRMPTVLVTAQVSLAIVSIGVAFLLRTPKVRIGVYVQSAARWNTFIALALGQELLGAQGVALVAVAAAVMIPVANLVSVIALMRFSGTAVKNTELARQLAINPLVLACVIGIGLNFARIPLPAPALNILDLLAQATIALGLLTTGAAIQVKGRSAPFVSVLSWSLLRLLGMPLIAGILAFSLGVHAEILLVMMIATSVPTASNGTILARQLGADANLAANLIATQTVLAIGTIAFVLWLMSSYI
ncbi:MAG: AEC family transporter, partial [Pseudomonadota bacterium]